MKWEQLKHKDEPLNIHFCDLGVLDLKYSVSQIVGVQWECCLHKNGIIQKDTATKFDSLEEAKKAAEQHLESLISNLQKALEAK
jgi:hypothetical protein